MHRLAVAVDAVGIVGIDLDRGDVAGAVEIGLRLLQRHEHEGVVVFRHADLEHRGDLVDLDARRGAHRRHRAARRHQRDVVARVQRELIGEPAADGDALPIVEAAERALLDVVDDRGQAFEVFQADAADQHAAGVERRGRQRLAFDDGRGEPDAFDAGDAGGDLLPVGERLFQRLDQQMAVEAEDLVEQFLAEAVHHRHHDDQGGDAQHDAEEGEPGDDRDESFLAPRPQIAQRQHPLERREGPRPVGLGHERFGSRL